METPPDTPPPTTLSSIDYLDIHYWDFAYEEKGPFRMPAIDIADTTSKTFAECAFPLTGCDYVETLTHASRLLSGDLMEIHVGKAKRQWSLHRNLLSFHSKWFRQQTAAKFGEKRNRLELIDEDPRAFELLVKWLYQGKIDDVSRMAMERKWDYAFACQQLYILCEKLNMPELKNVAIDQFRKGCFEAGLVPGAEEMILVYQKTSPRSPFRLLVSDIAARQLMDPECEHDSSTYRDCFAKDPDFAIDVVNAIKDGAGAELAIPALQSEAEIFSFLIGTLDFIPSTVTVLAS